MKDLIDYFTEREWYLMRFVHDTFRQPYSESSLENWLSDGIADGGIIVADQVLKSAPEDARIAALEAQLAASESKCAELEGQIACRNELRNKLAAALARAEEAERVAVKPNAELLARLFHENYERLAPSFGYETRIESRVAWGLVPNKALMIAAVSAALRQAMGVRGDE